MRGSSALKVRAGTYGLAGVRLREGAWALTIRDDGRGGERWLGGALWAGGGWRDDVFCGEGGREGRRALGESGERLSAGSRFSLPRRVLLHQCNWVRRLEDGTRQVDGAM